MSSAQGVSGMGMNESGAGPQSVTYECADCAKPVKLKPNDAIACHECGCRIVYKPRTSKPIQYLAR